MQRTIQLDDEQFQAIERQAAAECRSVDELIRQAVEGYLARRGHDWSDWGDRFDALVARIQGQMPPGVTSEEIEADISGGVQPRDPLTSSCLRDRGTRGPQDLNRPCSGWRVPVLERLRRQASDLRALGLGVVRHGLIRSLP